METSLINSMARNSKLHELLAAPPDAPCLESTFGLELEVVT